MRKLYSTQGITLNTKKEQWPNEGISELLPKGANTNCAREKAGRPPPHHQVIEVNITGDRHVNSMYHLLQYDGKSTTFLWSPSPQPTQEKCASVCHSVVSDSLRPHGLQPIRLSCPWDSPGKNIGVDSHSLLQGIFPTQGLNTGLLHCRQILYHLTHQGSPLPGLIRRKLQTNPN